MTLTRLELPMRPLVLVLAACARPPAPEIPWEADGAPPVAAPAAPSAAPEAPARACPAGWTEDPLDGGGHACRPFAAVPACDVTSAQFPGEAACAPIGATCPTGAWPDDVTDAIYVAAGGTGDGSRAAPFGSLAAAVAVAQDGDTIVVGAGTFEAGVTIAADVTLRGLCPGETVLTLSGEGTAVVATVGSTVTVRDLRISHSDAVGLDLRGGVVTVAGVVVDDVGTYGISGNGVELTLDEVRVSKVRPAPETQMYGRGVTFGRGRFVAKRLQVDQSHQAGVWIESDKEMDATLEDFVVYGMTPQASDNNRGVALRAYGASGDVTVRRAFVAGGNDYAVATFTPGTSTFEDVWVQDVGDDLYDGGAFGGVGAQSGGMVARGVTVRGAPASALRYGNGFAEMGQCVGEDLVVSGVRVGAGIGAVSCAAVTLARVDVSDNTGAGLAVEDYAALFTAMAVTDVRAANNAGGGVRSAGAEGTLDRLVATDNAGAGLQISGGHLSVTDATITSPSADGAGVLAESARVALTRVAISDVVLVGVSVAPANLTADLVDVSIADVRADASAGFSLGVNGDGDLTLQRVSITGTAGGGVSAFEGTATLEDVAVSAIGATTDGALGIGIQLDQTTSTLDRVTVSDAQDAGISCDGCVVTANDVAIVDVAACPTCDTASGVWIGPDGGIELNRARVAGCPVGLRAEGVIAVYDGVLEDNDVAVDATDGWYGGVRVAGGP